MRLAVIGDSHVVALGAALERDRAGLVKGSGVGRPRVVRLFSFPETLRPFFAAGPDGVRLLNEGAARQLERALGMPVIGPGVVDAVAVSMAYTTSILLWSDTWRAHRPWRCCPPAFHPVSDGVVAATTLGHFRHALGFLAALRATGLPVLAVEAPPVRADDHAIGHSISAEAILEVDRLARAAVRGALDAMGVGTVPAPAEAYEGPPGASFLQREFWHIAENDHHHANADYGALQLRDVLALAAREGRDRAEPGPAGVRPCSP